MHWSRVVFASYCIVVLLFALLNVALNGNIGVTVSVKAAAPSTMDGARMGGARMDGARMDGASNDTAVTMSGAWVASEVFVVLGSFAHLPAMAAFTEDTQVLDHRVVWLQRVKLLLASVFWALNIPVIITTTTSGIALTICQIVTASLLLLLGAIGAFANREHSTRMLTNPLPPTLYTVAIWISGLGFLLYFVGSCILFASAPERAVINAMSMFLYLTVAFSPGVYLRLKWQVCEYSKSEFTLTLLAVLCVALGLAIAAVVCLLEALAGHVFYWIYVGAFALWFLSYTLVFAGNQRLRRFMPSVRGGKPYQRLTPPPGEPPVVAHLQQQQQQQQLPPQPTTIYPSYYQQSNVAITPPPSTIAASARAQFAYDKRPE